MAVARILVVEDDNIVAMELRDRLEGFGYAIAGSASYGEEAVGKAGETRPDLVLMDIRLRGEMDGVAASSQIRSRYGIPVIYLTANADEDTLGRARATHPSGFVRKPFDEAELRTAIRRALCPRPAAGRPIPCLATGELRG